MIQITLGDSRKRRIVRVVPDVMECVARSDGRDDIAVCDLESRNSRHKLAANVHNLSVNLQPEGNITCKRTCIGGVVSKKNRF